MLFADASRGRPYAKDPAVVRFGSRLLMYYSIPPYGDGRPGDGWAIGIAESSNLDDWRKIGEILPAAPCELNGICAPGAVVLAGKVHLFYQTYGNGAKDAICHASSSDGLRFERDPANPVWRPSGAWTCGRAIDADVVAYDGRLLLYAATRDPLMRIQMITGASAPLDSGFGPDSWTQLLDAPLLKPELPWEQECVEAPAVCRRDGFFYLFYGGAYNNKPQQIGCARSRDGVHYERLFQTPFLPCGAPGSWNSCESGHPFAFTDDDGSVHLFYQGDSDLGRTWLLSRVELAWRDGKPALP